MEQLPTLPLIVVLSLSNSVVINTASVASEVRDVGASLVMDCVSFVVSTDVVSIVTVVGSDVMASV